MKDSNPGAIIFDGDFQALGLMRSLDLNKVPICLLSNTVSIAKFSNIKKRYFRLPSSKNRETYLNFLVRLAEREDLNGWVIFANNDEQVMFLSKEKDKIERYYRLAVPSWGTVKYCIDKRLTYEKARDLDVPIPETRFVDDKNELAHLDLEYPIVLKPSVKTKFYKKTKKKALIARDSQELQKQFLFMSSIVLPSNIVIQEMIPGGPENLYSFCPVFKNGKVLGRVMANRKRQHPMDFGRASTYAVSVNIPELETIGTKFLSGIDYYGLAEVEFMYDPRDGKYKLLEINSRIWGWHTLALASGVNLPYLLFKDLLGDESEQPTFREGVIWNRILTDAPILMKRFLKGELSIADYVKHLRKVDEFATFSERDILPFLIECFLAPYLWIKKGY